MTDIAELFQRDPLQLAEQDLDLIINKFREMRSQYHLGAAMAGSTKPKTEKQKQTLSLLDKLDLKLDF